MSLRKDSRRPRGDDDDWWGPTFLGNGVLSQLAGPDDAPPKASGRLYVPDPEQRSGWREHYVRKEPDPKPGPRPIGFGR